jgi:hypothetical protein
MIIKFIGWFYRKMKRMRPGISEESISSKRPRGSRWPGGRLVLKAAPAWNVKGYEVKGFPKFPL